MKKNLLLTTALIAVLSTPAMAEEQQGWFETMKNSVQSWFGGQQDTNSEVEAYLDEVTIAVPPMTGEEAAAIQPAAGGDYIEDVEQTLQAPAAVAPGSMQFQEDETSFNTEFTGTNGSVAAFEDPMNADDLANIMPAAGDAEEITDESIVVAEEAEQAFGIADEASEMAEEAQETATNAADIAENVEQETENSQSMVEAASDAQNTAQEAQEMAEEAQEMAEDVQKEIENMAPASGNMMENVPGTSAY